MLTNNSTLNEEICTNVVVQCFTQMPELLKYIFRKWGKVFALYFVFLYNTICSCMLCEISQAEETVMKWITGRLFQRNLRRNIVLQNEGCVFNHIIS